jgi:hypothetical protein
MQQVDLPEVLAENAVEAVTYHWDGYYTSNNYRVYHDPTDGQFAMIPWGTDQTWGWLPDVYGAGGRIMTWCLDLPECREMYDHHLWLAATVLERSDLIDMSVELETFLTPHIPLDARGYADVGWFQGEVAYTRSTIAQRPEELITRLELGCTGQNDPPECYSCEPVAFGVMCTQPVDWYEAVATCRRFGMELVMPSTARINNALSAITAPYGSHWIGLSDTVQEGRFVWLTNNVARFTRWWPGEPNDSGGEDCVGTNFGGVGWWNDYNCGTQLPFACQDVP